MTLTKNTTGFKKGIGFHLKRIRIHMMNDQGKNTVVKTHDLVFVENKWIVLNMIFVTHYCQRQQYILCLFLKTSQGISNRITKIRSQLSSSKRDFGFIDDGRGERYYLFHLYLLLGDNRRSSEFIKWYEENFPVDSGEPFATSELGVTAFIGKRKMLIIRTRRRNRFPIFT
jgi:hypothetical protein